METKKPTQDWPRIRINSFPSWPVSSSQRTQRQTIKINDPTDPTKNTNASETGLTNGTNASNDSDDSRANTSRTDYSHPAKAAPTNAPSRLTPTALAVDSYPYRRAMGTSGPLQGLQGPYRSHHQANQLVRSDTQLVPTQTTVFRYCKKLDT